MSCWSGDRRVFGSRIASISANLLCAHRKHGKKRIVGVGKIRSQFPPEKSILQYHDDVARSAIYPIPK
jgi:hypothetical protein